MIDFQNHTWTANGGRTLITCDDGRTMGIVPVMTDQYLMSVVQRVYNESAAAAAQDAVDAVAQSAVKLDATIKYLVTHTPAEIDAYVTANATNLATAVALLSKLAQAVSVLGRKELR